MEQSAMKWHQLIGLGIAAMGTLACPDAVLAQSTAIESYHCADGTNFIVGYFPYDKRAYMQIDGGEVTLRKRLWVSGTRYAGSGVTLLVAKSGVVTVKHAKRPVTVCSLDLRQQ
jgi:membrane-bound inhibitor of C-type lysozyme